MKLIQIIVVAFTLILFGSSNAVAGKLYKWVDDNGIISYQDQPPPESATILSEKEFNLKSSDRSNSKNSNSSDDLPKVVVYIVDNCNLCDELISVLRASKVAHITLPLASDREAQNKILQKTGKIIAPSIFIGDDLVQGGTEENLKEKLSNAGFVL